MDTAKKVDTFDIISYVGKDIKLAEEIFEDVKFKYGKHLKELNIKEIDGIGYGLHFSGEMETEIAYEIRDYIKSKSQILDE